jgi:hypothetical protein
MQYRSSLILLVRAPSSSFIHGHRLTFYFAVSNATLNASVDAFTSYLQCDLATLKLQNLSQTSNSGGIHNAPLFTFSLSTKDCMIPNRTAIGGYYLDFNYIGDNFVFYDTWGTTDAVSCSQSDSDASDVRILISVGLIHYNSKPYPFKTHPATHLGVFSCS